MGPKACDDEMDLPDGHETYCDLRIIRMVAEIWKSKKYKG
jgi:hypothetical protein